MKSFEQQSLVLETLRLLKEREATLIEIQNATGISFYWLRRFLSNGVRDPSVNRIQKLYEHLSGKKLLPDVVDTDA